MLKLRNLTLMRRIYVKALALVTRLAYGADVLRRKPPDALADTRIRRINSELEFGPGEWEGSFLDAAFSTDASSARAAAHRPHASAPSPPRPAPRTDLPPFQLEDACPCIVDGVDAIVGDSLTRCFTAEPPEPWNFLTRNIPPGRWQLSPYVTLLWLLGLWVRYCVLLPIRMVTLVVGFSSFVFAYPLAGALLKKFPRVQMFVRKWLLRYLASVFVASWSGYVRFHGKRPTRQPNQIYVANHTSLIDVFVLVKDYNFSCIGQRHTGLAGAFQDLLQTAQTHVWFDREEGRDRKAVQRLLKEHVADGSREPMLVFPEGTCTTTEYCIMFKKGSFELGAKVYPIAMRYRKAFGDAFWNSTQTSFPHHLFDLMTSWSVVCDVYYLDPEVIQPGETTVQFANRVKRKICDRAGLINVNWDGFLKRHRISPKFLEQRQKAIAASIMRRMQGEVPRAWSTSALSLAPKLRGSPEASRLKPPKQPGVNGISGVTLPPVSVAAAARSSSTPSNGHDPSRGGDSRVTLRGVNHAPLNTPTRAAAALSAAAQTAVRWGVAFAMVAIAGAITAIFLPASWRIYVSEFLGR